MTARTAIADADGSDRSPTGPVVRVVPDVAGLDKEFDYLVSPGAVARVGTEVRVDLGPRRVGGWVVATDAPVPDGVTLRPLAKVRGWGPEPEVIDLAGWAAWRWAGQRRALLATASPPVAVPALPAPATRAPAPPAEVPPGLAVLTDSGDLGRAGPVTLRLPPSSDPTTVVAGLAQLGPILVIVPTAARAEVLAGRLRRAGGDVAILPEDWAQARAGAAVVIGTRRAAWGPCPGLTAMVVIDGHDEALAQEQAPTWHATTVAAERARRAGVPCVVLSPCPTLELVAAGPVRLVDRTTERRGWARLEVVDRRGDDPRLGLYSERLVALVRAEDRVVCVLNRTGRARLLSCTACGELTRCERCAAAVGQVPVRPDAGPAELVCPRCGERRPSVCLACGSTALSVRRVGVSRAREDLERLAGRPVGEVTASTGKLPDTEVIVGTEAVLHRLGPDRRIGAVAFVDTDQELLAARVRAAEEALALFALASRLVGGRDGLVLAQTRVPDHPVLRAAALADPAVVTAAEAPTRRALALPPDQAVALVSGPAAAEYVGRLRDRAGADLDFLGPADDQWLVKAASPERLADALAGSPRPPGRLRVAVDPVRI